MPPQRLNNDNSYCYHEFLGDTLPYSTYLECSSCKNRTQLICVKCSYCYSCHWKKEQLEYKIQYIIMTISKNWHRMNKTVRKRFLDFKIFGL